MIKVFAFFVWHFDLYLYLHLSKLDLTALYRFTGPEQCLSFLEARDDEFALQDLDYVSHCDLLSAWSLNFLIHLLQPSRHLILSEDFFNTIILMHTSSVVDKK